MRQSNLVGVYTRYSIAGINKLAVIHKNITMKLLFLLLLPLYCFSQEIVGVWKKNDKSDTAIEFKSDGTFNMIELKNPEKKVLLNVNVTYRTFEKDGIRYIEYEYHFQGHMPETDLAKYKIENGLLYLPRAKNVKGLLTTTEDYQEVYSRVN